MTCPGCGKENPSDRGTCAECGASLVTGGERVEPEVQLVPVFATGDATRVPFVRSLLDDAGIEHLVQGEGAQELVGFGRAGTGFNLATGPVRFYVREADLARATELLAHLEAGDLELPADQDVERS